MQRAEPLPLKTVAIAVSTMQVPEDLETRRLGVFLAVAFGLAWATGLAVFATGGLADSPTLVVGLPLWLVLVSGPYMFAPAVGNVAARVLTDEGWAGLLVRPRFREHWRWWALGWLLPVALVVAGGALYFGVLPGQYGGMDAVRTLLAGLAETAGQPLPFGPAAYVALQVGAVLLVSPVVNAPFTFGEEFGWRGYLLPKLAPLGWRRALLAHGVIWGVWHWPIIAMGYNYGHDYTGAPVAGLLAMVVFTVGVGVVLGWVTLRGGSIWPAVLGHAAVNGAAGLPELFLAGEATPLLGPTPVGLVAMLPWLAVAGWVLAAEERLEPAPAFADAAT